MQEIKRHCPRNGHKAFSGRRCPECERVRNQERGSASSRGYDGEWRKVRLKFLQKFPNCEICGEKATDVDHVVGLKEGGSRLDESNLRPFCHAHHSQRTGRDQVKVGRKS